MKKFFGTMIFILMITTQVEAISYEEATFAINTINQNLYEWKCTPLKIWYGGDEFNNADNIHWMNQLAKGQGYEQKFSACMVFYSNFRSPNEISAWNPDSVYENWSWYFGLYDDGTWKLLTWGY